MITFCRECNIEMPFRRTQALYCSISCSEIARARQAQHQMRNELREYLEIRREARERAARPLIGFPD